MLGQLHIHRPSLDRYVITHIGSLQGVDYKRVGGKYHIIQWGQIVKQLDLKKITMYSTSLRSSSAKMTIRGSMVQALVENLVNTP